MGKIRFSDYKCLRIDTLLQSISHLSPLDNEKLSLNHALQFFRRWPISPVFGHFPESEIAHWLDHEKIKVGWRSKPPGSHPKSPVWKNNNQFWDCKHKFFISYVLNRNSKSLCTDRPNLYFFLHFSNSF
jgi:hypothetical protein